ncbi:MAG TPA: membrane dipeptidase [Solirubrobacterales bacterium]|nr:membrane dipeptidase [Solirubrobacterales bacterium]
MIADLHSHYPMHLVPSGPDAARLVRSPRARRRLLDRIRALIVGLASRFANYESLEAGPRVTMPLLQAGDVRIVLSVLYSPFDEFDLALPYGSPPTDRYPGAVLRQLELVERDVERNFPGPAAIARDPRELDSALAAGKIALVHCVEGGFHLGGTPDEVERAVERLARRGVAYITIAHLVWRSVATNANAIPFLPSPLYSLLFPQPRVGLTELGRAAVRAMVRHGVLVDVTHMSARALDDTFALLDELDPERSVPVIASHGAYRFGRDRYNLDEPTVEQIAARDGVIGLLLAEHQLTDGIRLRRTSSLAESLEVVFRHLDRIREIAGSHRHSAIGSDLDGFIKPTLAGLENTGALGALRRALAERYGAADAELIASGNALRLLRSNWRSSLIRLPSGEG